MSVRKLNPARDLAEDLSRGCVVVVNWSRKALPGSHYAAIGNHDCDLPVGRAITCLRATDEVGFTRPGYSEAEDFSEGVVRERASRFWNLGRKMAGEMLNGLAVPTTLLVGVPEGKTTFLRYAFAIDEGDPLVYYHNGRFGFRLMENMPMHDALGSYLGPRTPGIVTPDGISNGACGVRVLTPENVMAGEELVGA